MFDRPKFTALVHYVCWRCTENPAKLGAVKLNKSLWIADLSAYYHFGESITGARYVKRKYGPVPQMILPVLEDLETQGILTIRDAKHYNKQKKEYLVHRSASRDFLTERELNIVEQTIMLVCDSHTAASISEASHDHIWKAAKDGEEIPHFTVFARPGQITDNEREWARQQLQEVA